MGGGWRGRGREGGAKTFGRGVERKGKGKGGLKLLGGGWRGRGREGGAKTFGRGVERKGKGKGGLKLLGGGWRGRGREGGAKTFPGAFLVFTESPAGRAFELCCDYSLSFRYSSFVFEYEIVAFFSPLF